MTVVAAHQPNYLPWLGYFSKMSQADVFVFLDDAQYTKNSYINRVSVLCNGVAKWLTIPVRVPLGTAIRDARPSDESWVKAHVERLSNYYRKAPAREEALDELGRMFENAGSDENIADINISLIRALAKRLGVAAEFRLASELNQADKRSDDRLVALVSAIDPRGVYLSGAGATSYQHPEKFAAEGVGLQFTAFHHPVYPQGNETFVAGLSALDAVFWLGWEGAGAILRGAVGKQ